MKNTVAKRIWAVLLCCSLLLSCGAWAESKESALNMAAESVFADKPYLNNVFLANHVQKLYNDQNGMAVNETNDICQTGDGYLWIANYSGLTRYDGKRFETFNPNSQPALGATGIISLFVDSKNRLWIGSNDSGLWKWEKGAFSQAKGTDLGLSVRGMAEDSQGNIYAATSSGLGRVGESGALEAVTAPGFEQNAIADVAVDQQDQLWVLLSSGEVVMLRKGVVVLRVLPDQEGFGGGSSLYADPEGPVWVGTEKGISLRYMPRGERMERLPEIVAEEMGQINSYYRDKTGRLWMCGDNALGYLSRANQITLLEDSLVANSVERVFQDYEGTFWVASSRQGLLKLSDSKFFNLGSASKLPKDVINATQVVWGDLYLAGDAGLIVLDEAGQQKTTPLTQLLQGIRLRQLYVDSKDRLWISTYQEYGAICALKDGSYTYYNQENTGLQSNAVRSVLELADGRIAIATGRGIDVLENGALVQQYGVEQGLLNPTILCMMQGPDGRLFAGSDGNGIYIIDLNTREMENITTEKGLTTGVILRMAQDVQGRGLWISSGNQLDFYDFETGRCGPVEQMPSLQSNIFDLYTHSDGRLFLLSAKGMVVADTSAFQGLGASSVPFPLEEYNRNAGLSATITANSWSYIDDSGTMYLCLNPGVNVIGVDEIAHNIPAPRVAITRVMVGDKESTNSKVVVPPDVSRVTVEFSVLSFVEQERINVTYQMEGFDPKPITVPWTEQFSVSYTNLDGGDYVFRVSAENGDGVPSQQPAFATIQKARALTEYPLFIAAVAVTGLLFIWLVILLYFRAKTKKIQKRQQEYRHITEQSLRTIANTIDAKDSNTNGHSIRVAKYAREIARRMGLEEQDQEHLYYCALLHDIGKIGIPDAILHKPGALTDEELSIMRSHASIGGEILKDFQGIPDICTIVASHHEDFGGNGYPRGAKEDEIPLFAQIIRVADAYDAMASQRSYRASMSQMYILSELEKHSGSQFNPQIAALMEDLIREGFIASEDF